MIDRNVHRNLPPGLFDFANAYQLSEKAMLELAQVWDTIRGRRPRTMEEWANFWRLIEQLTNEGDDE